MKLRTKIQGRLLASTIIASTALVASPLSRRAASRPRPPRKKATIRRSSSPAPWCATRTWSPRRRSTRSARKRSSCSRRTSPKSCCANCPARFRSIGSAVNNGNGGASFVNLRGLGSNRNVVLIDGVRLVPAELDGRFDLNNVPLALDPARRRADRRRLDDLRRRRGVGRGQLHHPPRFRRHRHQPLRADHRAGRRQHLPRRRHDRRQFRRRPRQRDPARRLSGSRPGLSGRARLSRCSAIGSDTGGAGGSGTAVPSRFTGVEHRRPMRRPGEPTCDDAQGTRQVNDAGTAFNRRVAVQLQPVQHLSRRRSSASTSTARRNYQISDAIEIYTRGLFSKNTVDTIIAPSGAFGIAVSVAAQQPVPDAGAAQRVLRFDTQPASRYAPRFDAADLRRGGDGAAARPMPPIAQVTTQLSPPRGRGRPAHQHVQSTTIFDYRLGARGGITDSIDWDVFGSLRRSRELQAIQGYTLNSRVRQSLADRRQRRRRRSARRRPNGCVPVNWFGPAGNATSTPAAIDFLNETSTVRTRVTPGPGARHDLGRLRLDHPLGGRAGQLRGRRRVPRIYRLAGLRHARPERRSRRRRRRGAEHRRRLQRLRSVRRADRADRRRPAVLRRAEARGGIRYSSYNVDAPGSPSFTTTTWKVGGTWAPIDGLRFRGNYSRAVRAPNIAELFSPVNTGLTNLNDDPCANLDDQPACRSPAVPCRPASCWRSASRRALRRAPIGAIGAADRGPGQCHGRRQPQPAAGEVDLLDGRARCSSRTSSPACRSRSIITTSGSPARSPSPTPDDAITACFGAPTAQGNYASGRRRLGYRGLHRSSAATRPPVSSQRRSGRPRRACSCRCPTSACWRPAASISR